MDTMQITSLEQVPAGLTFLLKKVNDLEAIINSRNIPVPQPTPEPFKTYTRKEATEMLHISLSTLDAYVADGKITATRLGTRILFTKDAVESALKEIQPAKKIA